MLHSISEYSQLIGNWTINPQEKETEESHPWKISESELIAQNAKVGYHLTFQCQAAFEIILLLSVVLLSHANLSNSLISSNTFNLVIMMV